MRILHISDLHYEKSNDYQKVIDALCQDINITAKEKSIDAIVCTGDVANKGKTSKSAEIVSILKQIQAAAEKDCPMIICPGNHDMDLASRDEIYQGIYERITSSQEANKVVSRASSDNIHLFGHIENYIKIARSIDENYYTENLLFFVKKITHNNIKVGFASLNSSWTTKGGGVQDYGHLFIGDTQIDSVLQELNDCQIKIAIMHHTLEWLSADERTAIQRSLSANFDALLCGHNHENNANQLFSNVGTLFTSNTGCIYQSSKYFNGYSIIDLDFQEKKWDVQAREYYYQRNEFDDSLRFARNGRKSYQINNNLETGGIVIPGAVMTAAQQRANTKLLSYSASDVAPKQVGAIFVEPPLALVSEKKFVTQEQDDNKTNELSVSISEIAEKNRDVLFLGKRESGKTILLHQIAVNRFMEFYGNAHLSLIIDIGTLPRLTLNAIIENALTFIDGELTKKDLVGLLNAGNILIGLDNIQLHNHEHVNLISEFCKTYPNARYIFVASEEIIDEMSLDSPPSFGRNPLVVYIHSLKNKQIKELVCKWFGDQSNLSRQKIKTVDQLINKLNIPKTPFLVSVLLWVIEQKPNVNLINQASAVEVLIEGLLEKFKESKSRSEYDSTIQQHFLADFALNIDQKETEWVTSLEFEEFVVQYFKKKGLEVSTRGFTDELLRKGLLFENNRKISFKFDCFRAFFLAKKFSENSNLWKAALDEYKIGKYITELDLFTGLHRNRMDVLEESRVLCHKLLVDSGMSIDLGLVEELGTEGHIFDELRLSAIEKEVFEDEIDDEIRENLTNRVEQPSIASIDHEESRKRQNPTNSNSQLNFISSLRAFSVILRNSELIDDIEMKQACLDDALKFWAQAMLTMLDITRKHKFDLGTESNFNALNINSESELRKFVKLLIPVATMALMAESLATPKLNTFVMQRVRDKQPAIRTFANFLLLDTLTREGANEIKALLKDHGRNSIISQTLFFKLMSMYTFGINNESLVLIRECLAEAFSALRGIKSKENSSIKARFLQHLDRQVKINKED